MFVWFGLALTGFAALNYGAGISRSITDAFISSGSALVRSVSILQHQAAARSFRLSKVR